MKRQFLFMILAAAFSIQKVEASDNLWNSFLSPRQEARTKLWWFHGETTTTREGIDADLTAFKAAGIGGVVYYDQTHGTQQGAFPALSQQWWDMLKYAALRAKELGLTFEIAASNGYVTGGPWVTPELGMQKIVTLRSGDSVPKGFKEITRITLPQGLDTCIQRGRITLKTMAYKLPVMPEGYNFDVCTMRSLRAWKENRNSHYAPEYKVLVVQDRTWITPEAEALFEEMKALGLFIVRCDKGEKVEEALALAGFKPDMRIESRNEADDKTYFCHRKTGTEDIYFVYNHSNHDCENVLELRDEQHNIELWNPLTGERKPASDGIIRLKPYESIFVIANILSHH